MPDNQQRAKAAGERRPTDPPSTGRRGSHPHQEPAKHSDGPRSGRKQNSLRESRTPVEQGGE